MKPGRFRSRVGRKGTRRRREFGAGPERNPDVRAPLETLDDWILFGPRFH